MLKLKCAFLLFLMTLAFSVTGKETDLNFDGLTFYTEEYPPFNYSEKTLAIGIFPDILVEAFKIGKTKYTRNDIKVVPWSFGYKKLEHKKNVCLFGIGRTEKREKLFTWIGPILENYTALFGPTNTTEIKDLSKFNGNKILTVRSDIANEILIKNGILKDFIIEKKDFEEVLKYLKVGKIKYFAYGIGTGKYYLKKKNLTNKFKEIHGFDKYSTYFGCNKDSDEEKINKFKEVIKQVKEKEIVKKMTIKYLGN